MRCGRRAVVVALLLSGCGVDATVESPTRPVPDPGPTPSQAPETLAAAQAVARLLAAVDATPAPTEGAASALTALLDRLRAEDPVAGGEPVFASPSPPPAPSAVAAAGETVAAAAQEAEDALRAAALAADRQPLRLLFASGACTARAHRSDGPASVQSDAAPRHFQGTTVAASLPIALSHAWALVYGLGVGLGRLDGADPLRALGAARLAAAKEVRNELRDAVPGVPPVQPASFELPTGMATSAEIRAGWGALELGLLEGLGRLVAAGGPGVPRWLDLMVAQVDAARAVGTPLPSWPGWA